MAREKNTGSSALLVIEFHGKQGSRIFYKLQIVTTLTDVEPCEGKLLYIACCYSSYLLSTLWAALFVVVAEVFDLLN